MEKYTFPRKTRVFRGNVNKTNGLLMVLGDPLRNVNKTNGKLYISTKTQVFRGNVNEINGPWMVSGDHLRNINKTNDNHDSPLQTPWKP